MKHLPLLIALMLGLVGLLWLYYRFDPTDAALAPKCGFKLLTGWDCPACGGQRALHAVLNGAFGRALAYNPFVLISIPYLLAVAYTTFARNPFAERCRRVVQHKWTIRAFFCLVVVWWIVRNTAWWERVMM